jgi:hypothetical protein
VADAEPSLPQINTTNIVVARLQGIDKYLFNRGIFPAGGVGYKDSSLPYDGAEPILAAFMTVRAQAIRKNLDSVMDVIRVQDGDRLNEVVIIVDEKSAGPSPRLDELVRQDPAMIGALDLLRDAGITVSIDSRDVPSTRLLFDNDDTMHSLIGSDGRPVRVLTQPDPKTGTMNVVASAGAQRHVRAAGERFGKYVSYHQDELWDATGHDDWKA